MDNSLERGKLIEIRIFYFFFLEKIVLIRENYEIIRERVASNWNRRRW